MRIMAIETSCDDTCIAIVEVSRKKSDFNILANIVSSQVKVHQKWGGVYPTLAKREHQKNLTLVLKHSLEEAGLLKSQKSKVKSQNDKLKLRILEEILAREKILLTRLKLLFGQYEKPNIDKLAVTIGPGLEPSLWVGINFAKALAYYWHLPVIPINHIEAHIFANWPGTIAKRATTNDKFQTIFPAICLIVSGGHTQLILMKGIGKYEILGETRDDAAGECFDKVAKILGLGYPGGPAIAAEAAKIRDTKSPSFAKATAGREIRNKKLHTTNYKLQTKLPRPMIGSKDYDFSFSGLKTAVLYQSKNYKLKTKNFVIEMAREVQQAIIDVLIRKTINAARQFKTKSIILGGGVTANEELRKQMTERVKRDLLKTKCFIPEPQYSTDNALMVASCAFFAGKRPIKTWKNLEAKANLRI